MNLHNKHAVMTNLKDAGCPDCIINEFFENDGRLTEQIRLLSVYRKTILNNLHSHQKHLECLDFLIYSLTKADMKGE